MGSINKIELSSLADKYHGYIPIYNIIYSGGIYLMSEVSMQTTAKLFITGRSQALRLPKEFRFPGTEVFIRRDPVTGEVILSPKPASWAEFFELADRTKIPADFMADREDFQRFLEFASKLNISH